MQFIQFIKQEIEWIKHNDPSLSSTLEIWFMPGFRALKTWYFTHKLYPRHPAREAHQ